MRLIDADAFIEYLGLDAENAREDNLGEIVTLEDFDRQPTAYNVGKVVEKKKKAKYEDELYPCNLAVEIEEAKSIVKSGGIE